MHYLVLLLEMVADLFPLSMKLDGFSLLVHQLVHQWENFHLESQRYMQLQMRRSWSRLLVFQTGRNDNVNFHSTYLWNFDKMHLNSSVWTDHRGFSGYRISEHGHWYFTGALATLQRISQADFRFCSLIIFEMSNRSPLFWPFHAWLCKHVEAAIFLFV